MSNVTVIGTLGADPELRFTPNGSAVCDFSIAENKGKGDDQVTHWFDVVCWKQLAENVAESLTKGTRVIVSGQLEQQTWDDRNGGGKRSKVQIVAWNVGPDLSYATASVVKNERRDEGR